ncbi:MAG: glycosyltransferase [Sulfobacillus thermotolerans]|nr:glycosyltransferase [Sulfobacillus thermotolerans]
MGRWACVLLWMAELLGLFQLGIFYFQSWHLPRSWLPDPEPKALLWPTVDILVPTYNEDLSILRRTLTGCILQDYPPDRLYIYVCDDGARLAVEHLAEVMGVRYLSRTTRTDAKAGNLNAALAQTTSEFVVIFDADMVPKPKAVKALVKPVLQNTPCAFSQAPQAFFNHDPFQHNLGLYETLPNEQDFFMRSLQAARAQVNALLFVGSNAAFRRQALEAIGGFPTGTITEDAATSLLLESQGWRGCFVPQVVAQGLAAESYQEFLHQRARWCRGNIQVFKQWNPLTLPGLSLMQRMIYLSGTLYWYFGMQKMIYLLAPLLYLDFDVRSLVAPTLWIVGLWLPAFLSQWMTFRRITRGSRTLWWSHVYEVVQAPVMAAAAFCETVGCKTQTFRVTEKNLTSDRPQVAWQSMAVFVVILAMTALGAIRRWHQMQMGAVGFLLLAAFWALYNAAAILTGVAVSVDWPRWRRTERFRVNYTTYGVYRHRVVPVRVVDLSEGGCAVTVTGDSSWSVNDSFQIFLNGVDVTGHIVQRADNQGDSVLLHVRWEALGDLAYRAVFRLTYAQTTGFSLQSDPKITSVFHGLRHRWHGTTRRPRYQHKSPKQSGQSSSMFG